MNQRLDFVLIAIFSCLVHELGHHYFNILSGVESKITLKGGTLFGLDTISTIPETLIPKIRKDPSRFVVNRVQASLAGIVGIIPLLIFSYLLPNLKRELGWLAWVLVLYTFWETATRDYPFLNQLFSEND